MDTLDFDRQLNALIIEGRNNEAFLEFYDENVVAQENDEPERAGRDPWMRAREEAGKNIEKVQARVLSHAVNGDVSFSEWEYDLSIKGMGPDEDGAGRRASLAERPRRARAVLPTTNPAPSSVLANERQVCYRSGRRSQLYAQRFRIGRPRDEHAGRRRRPNDRHAGDQRIALDPPATVPVDTREGESRCQRARLARLRAQGQPDELERWGHGAPLASERRWRRQLRYGLRRGGLRGGLRRATGATGRRERRDHHGHPTIHLASRLASPVYLQNQSGVTYRPVGLLRERAWQRGPLSATTPR